MELSLACKRRTVPAVMPSVWKTQVALGVRKDRREHGPRPVGEGVVLAIVAFVTTRLHNAIRSDCLTVTWFNYLREFPP